MSIIVKLQDAIANGLRDKLGDLVDVSMHGGRFTLEQIKRHTRRSPAVILACAGLPDLEIQGGAERVVTTRWVAMVMATDRERNTRDEKCIATVELILHLLGDQRWDLDDVHRTSDIDATNLFAPDVERHGLALWAVTWDQKVDLPGTYANALADFETLYTQWDLDTTDGIDDDAIDQIELPQ
jgi:phage gp37-like protein